MWDDWLGVLCGCVCVCGMTGLVSCVVVVYMWDDWLVLFQTNKRRQHILGSMLCGTS